MMKITAHRGYSGQYPENTMLAFEKAAEAGADEIELDVQLSRDGKVVVFHDESLERLTGVGKMVMELTLDELAKLNAAKMVHGEKFGFNKIPSFEEYLAWVKKTNIVTNIELKNGRYYYEGLEEKTIELINKYGLADRVYFSSFNHVSLMKCKKLQPAIPCGALVFMPMGNAGYCVKSSGLDFYHPDMKSLNDETVASCKKHGVGINVWTIDDMPGLLKAKACGCRSVITDFPDVCKVWVGSGK
ncbi:MAG: glycerophosphodiester phosphodiesterase [Treponema sp.]|nr:glycerophosphodiester phosphodiesterase [Treponema sp.]